MLVKTFSAKTTTELMEIIRLEMGDDAIILSTTEQEDGIYITAGIEDDKYNDHLNNKDNSFTDEDYQEENSEDSYDDELQVLVRKLHSTSSSNSHNETLKSEKKHNLKTKRKATIIHNYDNQDAPFIQKQKNIREKLLSMFEYHNIPPWLSGHLLSELDLISPSSAEEALRDILRIHFSFAPFDFLNNNFPVMLVGATGVGKTVSVAKIATEAVLNQIPVSVISTDLSKAGGIEQLSAFTEILQIELLTAQNTKELKEMVANCPSDSSIIIDSAGANPYEQSDIDALKEMTEAINAEPIFCFAAGVDALEVNDVLERFYSLGIERLLITRIDAAKRLGALIEILANFDDLALSYISDSPNVSSGLQAASPETLARILIKSVEK